MPCMWLCDRVHRAALAPRRKAAATYCGAEGDIGKGALSCLRTPYTKPQGQGRGLPRDSPDGASSPGVMHAPGRNICTAPSTTCDGCATAIRLSCARVD